MPAPLTYAAALMVLSAPAWADALHDNNVGNIRATGIEWADKCRPSGAFEAFATPEAGVAAALQNLRAGAEKGYATLQSALARWAPKGDGSNDPTAYAERVSRETGVPLTSPLPFNDPQAMAHVLRAMAEVEKGRPIYDQSVFERGVSTGVIARAPVTIPPPKAAPPPPPQPALHLTLRTQLASFTQRR